jgi:phenylacetic acid degradation protein
MIAWKTKGTELYQTLPDEMNQHWEPCSPLSEVPDERPNQEVLFDTWKKNTRNL